MSKISKGLDMTKGDHNSMWNDVCLFSIWKKIKFLFYITTLLIVKLNFDNLYDNNSVLASLIVLGKIFFLFNLLYTLSLSFSTWSSKLDKITLIFLNKMCLHSSYLFLDKNTFLLFLHTKMFHDFSSFSYIRILNS